MIAVKFPLNILLATMIYCIDVSEKTVSEEYTPLHLAARYNHSCSYDHSADVDDPGSESSKGVQNTASGAGEGLDGRESNTTASIEPMLIFLMNHQEVNICWEFQ